MKLAFSILPMLLVVRWSTGALQFSGYSRVPAPWVFSSTSAPAYSADQSGNGIHTIVRQAPPTPIEMIDNGRLTPNARLFFHAR
jgi:hypothetical protein